MAVSQSDNISGTERTASRLSSAHGVQDSSIRARTNADAQGGTQVGGLFQGAGQTTTATSVHAPLRDGAAMLFGRTPSGEELVRGIIMEAPSGTVQGVSGAVGRQVSVQLPTGLVQAFVETTATLYRGDTLMFSIVHQSTIHTPLILRVHGVPDTEYFVAPEHILRALPLPASSLRVHIVSALRQQKEPIITANAVQWLEEAMIKLAGQVESYPQGKQEIFGAHLTDSIADKIAVLSRVRALQLPADAHWYNLLRPIVLQENPTRAWNTLMQTMPASISMEALLADTERTAQLLWGNLKTMLAQRKTNDSLPLTTTQMPLLHEANNALHISPPTSGISVAPTRGQDMPMTGVFIEQLQALRMMLMDELSMQSQARVGQISKSAEAMIAHAMQTNTLYSAEIATEQLLQHFLGQQVNNAFVMEHGGTLQYSLFLPNLFGGTSAHKHSSENNQEGAIAALVEIDVDDPRHPARSSAVNFRVHTDMSALGKISVQGIAYQSSLMLTIYVAEPSMLSFVSEHHLALADILRNAGYTVSNIAVRLMEGETFAPRTAPRLQTTLNKKV